jgi:hypothetical protein
LLCHLNEFVVPFLTETFDEGFTQETIDGNVELLSFLTCAVAHFPTVIIESYEPSLESLDTNGIKGAADWLAE